MFYQTLFGIADTLANLGRERANPNACPENNLKIVDTCDCTDTAVCEDVYSDVVAAARSFAGFTYVLNGVTTVFSVLNPVLSPDGSGTVIIPVNGLIPVTDAAAIHEWMLKVLSIYEVEPALTVTWTLATTTVTYNHIGAGAITVITYDDASFDTPDARNCTLGVCCDYVLGKEGTIGAISDDGGATTDTLATEPYNYTGVPVTDEATRAQLATDLATSLGVLSVAFKTITVTVDDTAGNFKMVVSHQRGLTLTAGTDAFVECCCVEQYFA